MSVFEGNDMPEQAKGNIICWKSGDSHVGQVMILTG